ncbi:hypothetical protein Kpol_1066p9 [Vanderwaltozyma polyspora DSM 70294]|uniref:Rho-GAP domain-containing protein n=1 Tax=Vanderwaltozyma polyspora (strain ATCC 22028 / DSM 70294 / BCRC 21397 / CBS 2163 / NBRC 10782 / NRRL Y-8283 / UCD 57-17) TaxID=436907 RepID=A7TMN1_VANPO|nr:uncharacterized protein Kpol_1066p9 [Vanderwaltozyma polyspora DSM 70294]EDO16445.1 hypothetical protein Kpol_1066p9 [Vanderwaltozyma polyspora DSM 70294]
MVDQDIASSQSTGISTGTSGMAETLSEGDLFERSEIKRILDSDVAINTLLARLKQSLLTCEEFTKYIKKKYMFEEENVEELSKQYKHFFSSTSATAPSLRRSIQQILQFDGKMAQVKQSYISALVKMYEELSALLLTMTKMRKSIKEKGRRLEKDVVDSIHIAEKAQARYNSLCQDWEKLRLTDPTKTKLTLRGSKTTKEQEEELQRKIDAADLEYKQRVDHSTSLRNSFLNSERPKIVSELRDLILEIDTALTIQLQKYTIWTENLALNTGVTISPLEESKSMRSIAAKVTNERDLYDYLNKYNKQSKDSILVNRNLIPVPYKKHPSMAKGQLINPTGSFTVNSSRNTNNFKNSTTSKSINTEGGFHSNSSSTYNSPANSVNNLGSTKTSLANTAIASSMSGIGMNLLSHTDSTGNQSPIDNSSMFKPPSLNPGNGIGKPGRIPSLATTSSGVSGDSGRPLSHIQTNSSMPPGTQKNFKTFGVPLESLLEFEQEMVPAIVRQSIYVIDTYGLDLEGIYRKSANILEVSKLKEEIDRDPSNISMILPPKDYTEADIYVVGSLLKAFFSALPDPLIPSSTVPELKICLSIDDYNTRKNYIHGLIYKFPDAQYWTLRSLMFHLKRVSEHESENRMNIKGLSIIWGPCIVPQNDEDSNDINFQIKIMEVLFDVADQAFEPE